MKNVLHGKSRAAIPPAVAMLLAAFTGLALAAPPMNTILSVHPVDQESIIGQPYDPGDGATTVLSVPVASASGSGHYINMDSRSSTMSPRTSSWMACRPSSPVQHRCN